MERSYLESVWMGQGWLYLLVPTPIVTDLVETGRLPNSPREWVTEVVVGIVIAALVRKIRKEHLALQALARTDPLTGLLNRGSFDDAIEEEAVRARRSGRPLALVYLDLDNFKVLNDRGGHAAGDRALIVFADAVREMIRARPDRGFRIGGDEFALLLPDSAAQGAQGVVTRLWHRCVALDPECFADPLGVSAGVVELIPGESATDFVRRADNAMYRQKQARASRARNGR